MVYASHADLDVVSAYAVDEAAGSLTAIGTADAGGVNGVSMTVAPEGDLIFVCNFDSGSLSSIGLEPDGALRGLRDVLELPSGHDAPEVTHPRPQPHDVVVSPDGRHLLVPDRGLGRVHVVRADHSDGSLRHVAYASLRPRSGPRHIVFHPTLAKAYVLTEIDSTVVVCDWDGLSGTLIPVRRFSTLPEDFFAHSQTSEIAITADGTTLFASNRGMDTITRFEISEDGTTLTSTGWTPTGGRTPRHFCLSADDTVMLVANESSDRVVELGVRSYAPHLVPQTTFATPSPASVILLTTIQDDGVRRARVLAGP